MESIITGYIILNVKTKDGKSVLKVAQPMRSFVRNFVVMLETMFKGMDTKFPPPEAEKVTTIDGTQASLTFPASPVAYGTPLGWRINAEAGDILQTRNEPTEWGIVVGSGDSPTTIHYWRLDSMYPHGKSVGYINYLGTEMLEPTFDGTNVRLIVRRLMVNEANVNQTVREVGIIAREYYTWTRFLIARDVLDNPVTLPPSSLLEVTVVLTAVLAPFNVLFPTDVAVAYDSCIVTKF